MLVLAVKYFNYETQLDDSVTTILMK